MAGGGVIGLAVAAELARRGLAVTLIDDDRPGRASDAAAGMLAPISEAEAGLPRVVAFGLESLARYPAFVTQLEADAGQPCGLRTRGALWVALDADDRAELQHLTERLQAMDLAAELLDAPAARRLEPHLSPRVIAALHVAGDHQVDPRALCRALRAAIVARGGRIEPSARVQRLLWNDAGVRGVAVRMDGESIHEVEAQTVVVATGAWSSELLHPSWGLPPLRPVQGQALRLRGSHAIAHVVRTPHVYLVPRDEDELIVGATADELGFDLGARAGGTLELLRRAWQTVPVVAELCVEEITVGLRPSFSDGAPRIGPIGPPGLYVAIGHYRNGVLMAPATAHHLSAWIVDGRAPEALQPFAPMAPSVRPVTIGRG